MLSAALLEVRDAVHCDHTPLSLIETVVVAAVVVAVGVAWAASTSPLTRPLDTSP